MARFKEIYSPGCAFGGESYRATSDGDWVNLQKRPEGCEHFRTVRSITTEEWAEFVEQHGLDDPYRNGNPAIIAKLMFDPDYQ